MMEEKLTRSERFELVIERFLESDARTIPIKMYSREVKKWQKKLPNVLIVKESTYRNGLHNCLIIKQN